MRNQSQTRFAQTVSLISHNADFCRLRISKYPANAQEMKYFFTRPFLTQTKNGDTNCRHFSPSYLLTLRI